MVMFDTVIRIKH